MELVLLMVKRLLLTARKKPGILRRARGLVVFRRFLVGQERVGVNERYL
jgi:hypothetical protein